MGIWVHGPFGYVKPWTQGSAVAGLRFSRSGVQGTLWILWRGGGGLILLAKRIGVRRSVVLSGLER